MTRQILLSDFLLSIISTVWYSCLSSPQTLLRTLANYFSEIIFPPLEELLIELWKHWKISRCSLSYSVDE